MTRAAVFLDRDGTLNHDPGYVHRVADLRLLDGVIEGLSRIQSLGFELVITTNQSGVARGYFSEQQMQAFNQALIERLGENGIQIASVYHCPYHRDGTGVYRSESTWRKPAPGMILAAAAEHGFHLPASFAIGDKPSDVAAGRAAGCRTILLRDVTERPSAAQLAIRPDYEATDMPDAARFIEQTRRLATSGRPTPSQPHFPGRQSKGSVR